MLIATFAEGTSPEIPPPAVNDPVASVLSVTV